jgi:putative nucleotidyltransferase with HDIG domain
MNENDQQRLPLPLEERGNRAQDDAGEELAVARAPGERSARLSPALLLYIGAVTVCAAALIAACGSQIAIDSWAIYVTLLVVSIAFERVGIKIYNDTQVSAGVVGLFAIGVLYGAPGVAIASPIVVIGATAFTPSNWYKRLFDMSSYTVAMVLPALLFHSVIDVDNPITIWWVPMAMLAAVACYAINAALVAGVVSVSTRESFLSIWRDEHQWIFPYYLVFGVLGLALATASIALGIAGILAFVAPPLMMRFAMHQYVSKTEDKVLELKQRNAELKDANRNIMQMTRELTETYDGTLEALVLALDARDRETKGHSFRVATYVVEMARKLGVPENSQDWIDMYRGALLHDIGKIGVPDFILHKPGPLTPEEWEDMKRHPRIGHEMLRDISFLSGAAAIVEAHHERFDGKGYPRGLRGDEIPLGARIFAAADAFDAMTTDRPYRSALLPEMARDEIVRHSGTQFDPKVVQAFLLIYETLAAKAAREIQETQLVAPQAA